MSDIKELKDSFEKVKNLYETEFKSAVLKGQEESRRVGDQLGTTKEKLAAMEVTISKYDAEWEKHRGEKAALEAKVKALEAFAADQTRPKAEVKDPMNSVKPEMQKFYSDIKAFSNFIHVGEERMTNEEHKALATDADTTGGYLMPINMATQMIELNVLSSPIRQIASVETISQGDNLEIPSEGSTVFATGWTSERGSRSATTSGTFAMQRVFVHELYADPYVTQKMIDDTAFNIESYLARKVAEQFAKTENTAFVTGTGIGQPEGIMASTNNVTASQVVTAAGVFTAALMMDLQHSLEEPYASRATWIMKRASLGKIRQLAATTYSGQFLWAPGVGVEMGPTILGAPYVACNDVATVVSAAATARVIAFGDFKAGYRIVDRVGISMLRDPFTNKPYIEFYTTKRVGGGVVLPEAIKIGIVNS
jgi:HK97 family phage major capsid protein